MVDFGGHPIQCLNVGGRTVERKEATFSDLKAWTLEPGFVCLNPGLAIYYLDTLGKSPDLRGLL